MKRFKSPENVWNKRFQRLEAARGPAGVRNADYLDMRLPYAAGSLHSTVEDLYLWDQALDGEKVLPVMAKERMFVSKATARTLPTNVPRDTRRTRVSG